MQDVNRITMSSVSLMAGCQVGATCIPMQCPTCPVSLDLYHHPYAKRQTLAGRCHSWCLLLNSASHICTRLWPTSAYYLQWKVMLNSKALNRPDKYLAPLYIEGKRRGYLLYTLRFDLKSRVMGPECSRELGVQRWPLMHGTPLLVYSSHLQPLCYHLQWRQPSWHSSSVNYVINPKPYTLYYHLHWRQPCSKPKTLDTVLSSPPASMMYPWAAA